MYHTIKHILCSIFLIMLNTICCVGQSVGISGSVLTPDTSAILELSSTTKGFLMPRMTISQMTSLSTPAKGLMIFNTTLSHIFTNRGTTGAPNWQSMQADLWSLDGNGNTSATTSFLGTTDLEMLIFKTNNIISGRIEPATKTVCLGYKSAISLVSGTKNIALGTSTLQQSLFTSSNIAIGDSAFYSHVNTPSFTNNIAIGATAGKHTTGLLNTFIGGAAGYTNEIGTGNIGLGTAALYLGTDGDRNIALGAYSLRYHSYLSNDNVAIGPRIMMYDHNANENTCVGFKAVHQGSYNFASVFFGNEAGRNSDNGSYNIAIGEYALIDQLGSDHCIAIGQFALRENEFGSQNIGIGDDALGQSFDETGVNNIAIGYHSGWHNGGGSFNVAIGDNALDGNYDETPSYNVAIGDSCLFDIESGSGHNTAAGSLAGYSTTTGEFNTFFGREAASLNTTGSYCVAVGQQSMRESTTAIGMTAFGHEAGDAFNFGNNCTLIGSFTDADAPSYNSSTALGYNTAITASNQVRMGWLFSTSIGGTQAWSNISDGRYKQGIKHNVPGVDFIMALNPVTYTLNHASLIERLVIEDRIEAQQLSLARMHTRSTGFIAQEVEQAAQQIHFVFSGVDAPKNKSDMYGLRYEEFVVPLVKAVQEQQYEIESLKAQSLEMLRRLEEFLKK
ncbi:MAG: tail fiber domain-containing protein [Saprospiraceae bacterium]